MNRWNIDVNFAPKNQITLVGRSPGLTLTVIDHEKILDQIENKLELTTNYTEAKDILQRFTK